VVIEATVPHEGEPEIETPWLPAVLVVWNTTLAGLLDARQQVRFVRLCEGLLFDRGRRTVASALRACAGRDSKRHYYLLGSVERKTTAIAGTLLRILLQRLPGDPKGTPLIFAIDNSPTKRFGRQGFDTVNRYQRGSGIGSCWLIDSNTNRLYKRFGV
jgi:hypothetical protein